MAAEVAISSVVELLGNQLIQKVKSLQGIEEKVELLREELKRMQSFLKDANKKQFEDERVRNWISDIRELAQDAQDTIEIFLLHVESAKNGGLIKRCTSFPKRMHHLDKIGDEIESIQARLDAIDKSRERYGIKDLGEAAESASRWQIELRRRLIPWQKDEHLVGVEDDVKKLLQESILCEKKGLCIAVLEGMGGIGKSTLAREIYNHPDVVAGPFDRRGWVVVSSEFTPQETIKQLIFDLPGSDKQKVRELEETMKDKPYLLQMLQEMLYKQLKGKSYLIVLDDVWEKEHLESLINAFPNQQDKAGRLLVTTRNKIITKYDQYVHKMSLLDHEKSWELLLKKAFIGSSIIGKCPDEFESVGKQILEKCHGLPLAISVVAALLVETQTESGWEQVLNQINSYLGKTKSDVSTILELSYQNLSPQLKSCFLCLAFFKEDFTIPTKRLLNIWDAQGLIQQEGSKTTDEIVKGYLNELINQSMLQIQDLNVNNQVKSCRLHDLVREVCLRKAKEEIGLEIVKGEKRISSESSYKPRHRVVYVENIKTSSSNQNKHVRSLFLLNVQGGWVPNMAIQSYYWKSYYLLKTLELDGLSFYRLPNSFRSLIGLKCLKIYESRGSVIKLPNWFDHLRNLEVLDMKWCYADFPRLDSLEMDRLCHFCAYLVSGLTNINMWKDIECLRHIRHKDWMKCISTLTSSCHLRELGIRFDGRMIEHEELIKVRASLEKMQNLVILHLLGLFGRPTDIALVVPQLANLTKLKLYNPMSKCPTVSTFPPNLSHLTLTDSELVDDPMAELGKLPKLLFLKIEKQAYLGETMLVLWDGFPCLEALVLRGLDELKSVFIEEGGMPKLRHLRIRKCPRLNTGNLPQHINIFIE
ncbi:putative disease resistance protein At1g50180 [Salvia miltiorrhiza]|uniref:putative disease resistance protein At1g50180 n=1 Tax=Salvia miltiorrhiza TaxID=226208 RepID=UPI0025ABA5FB|nr:putative disease resistance protein At1g50180 [Salvia miltiorrhiza]